MMPGTLVDALVSKPTKAIHQERLANAWGFFGDTSRGALAIVRPDYSGVLVAK
jgi:hypothetical protein